MTRKSKRDIERSLETLTKANDFSMQDYLWADLKDYYDGALSPGEQVLLDAPDRHLSTEARRHIQ